MGIDHEKVVDGVVKGLEEIPNVLDAVKGIHGFIKDSEPAEINGRKGLLRWDYIIYNEITFTREDDGSVVRLFSSISDDKTEKKWNELKEKYRTEPQKQNV